MRTIRSLLWIGSGRGLTESGVTEAPELDVTWVPDVAEAVRLPKVHFDGILCEAGSAELVAAHPRGEYNSTRYPPDRIYPRRKTNRRTLNIGPKYLEKY